MVRLIKKQPLQSIDRHPAEHPAADRVDVQIPHGTERSALFPERVELLRAFEAAEEHGRNAGKSGDRRAADEMAHEEIEKRHEHQIEEETIG